MEYPEPEDIEPKKGFYLWYFWNHCFLGRQFPTRATMNCQSRSWMIHKYVCVVCKQLKGGNRHIYKKSACTRDVQYCCPSCHNKKIEKLLAYERSQVAKKSIELDAKFSNLLADCKKRGTCDILAAHHEALINDPERLTTEFMMSQICGEEKTKRYKAIREEGGRI